MKFEKRHPQNCRMGNIAFSLGRGAARPRVPVSHAYRRSVPVVVGPPSSASGPDALTAAIGTVVIILIAIAVLWGIFALRFGLQSSFHARPPGPESNLRRCGRTARGRLALGGMAITSRLGDHCSIWDFRPDHGVYQSPEETTGEPGRSKKTWCISYGNASSAISRVNIVGITSTARSPNCELLATTGGGMTW